MTIKNIKKNEINLVSGGDCLCECHHPTYGWGSRDSLKGMAPDSNHCHNVLCSDSQWDRSLCTEISESVEEDVQLPPEFRDNPGFSNPFKKPAFSFCTVL